MKAFTKLLFVAFVSMLGLVSCDKQEEVAPTIEINSVVATHDTVVFTIKTTGASKCAYLLYDGDVITEQEVFERGVVAKEVNDGISITVNQGIKLAKGKWVRMLDSDDILPLNSTEKMIELADKHNADMVYGTFVKTGKEPMDIAYEVMGDDFSYNYQENALKAVLNGRFTRMGQLIKREVLQKAKGADERVFIQDESIPLRVARLANGAIKMQANVVLVPKETNNLSKNTNQLDNDRFYAHYYMLVDHHKDLAKEYVQKIYEKALSANWKYVKKNIKGAYFTKDFYRYLVAKVVGSNPDFDYLKEIANKFDKLSNVLRSKNKK
jgi:glycosyltransferase involved in cell wall biosynthesis